MPLPTYLPNWHYFLPLPFNFFPGIDSLHFTSVTARSPAVPATRSTSSVPIILLTMLVMPPPLLNHLPNGASKKTIYPLDSITSRTEQVHQLSANSWTPLGVFNRTVQVRVRPPLEMLPDPQASSHIERTQSLQ